MTYYKLYNKRNDVVLTPEGQMYSNADDATLIAAQCLFLDKHQAEQMQQRAVSPKFKLLVVEKQ